MYPILFKIPLFGGVPVYTYGMMVALAFVVGIVWVNYESKRLGQDAGKATDLVFYIILSAIIGSRIVYIITTERERFLENPLMFFKIWEGGLVFYGGLIAAAAVGIWFVRRHKLPILLYCDIFAPAIALGHSIGRLGCLMAGCCYGKQVAAGAWYAITFPLREHTFAPVGIPLYPTQIMESAAEFLIFLVLFFLRKRKKFTGQLIATYLILYGVFRFGIEFIRGDMDRGFVIPDILSVSQAVSIVMIAIGIFLYARYLRGAKEGVS
jgi:phosphatidylglycerol:prolipoprotein diacylglycerol transferase